MRSLRILQVMVLICILMIPVLVFLFLRTFGANTYEIPILYQTGVDDPFGECDFAEGEQHYIPEFSFYTTDSALMGSEQMKGKITIVDFFFTSCPSICPVMSAEMERVQDAFRNEEKVQIYSISLDPEYDTPEVLAGYASKHAAEKGKWHFLTGSRDETYDLARCGFVLPATHGEDEPEDFVHSDKFVLVDEYGRIRGYYSGTQREGVDELILETKILLHGN
jgi:protein SCO1